MAVTLQRSSCVPFNGNAIAPLCQKYVTAPLVKRVITNQWQELLMIGGVILSVISAAVAFFYGSTFLTISFLSMGALHIMSAFYLRRYSSFQSLENSLHALSQERERLSTIATELQRENQVFAHSNEELKRTNALFRQTVHELNHINTSLLQTNAQLQTTNSSLQRTRDQLQQTNTDLKGQVSGLSIHVSHLQQSEKRIREQTERFHKENQIFTRELHHLNSGLRLLDKQIDNSQNLCTTFSQQLQEQQKELREQIELLKKFFKELSDSSSVKQRIHELQSLNKKIATAAKKLEKIYLKYEIQQARMEENQKGLTLLRQDFGQGIQQLKHSNQNYTTQNRQLGNHIHRFSKLLDTRI